MEKKDYKVLLLDAPQSIWQWFDGTLPSPALAVLASYVRTSYDVMVLDLNVDKTPWLTLKKVLMEFKPDLIGMPCTHTCHINEVRACSELIRKYSPDTLIVGGGIHFTVFYKDLLEDNTVDFVVMGEGERTFTELLSAVSDFKSGRGRYDYNGKIEVLNKIDGLAFRSGDEIIETRHRALIPDLDTIPLPSYDLFPMEKYKIPIYGGNETFGITFGRGCKNKCCFCSETSGWEYTLRRNSPEYAVKHIELLYKNYGRRAFIFADTDFLVDPDWCVKFAEILKQKQIKITFHIQTTCANVIKNESVIPVLKEAGLFEIMLGTESPFQEVLKKLRKTTKNRDIMIQAMQTVKKHGVLLMAMMFWGTEFDSKETLREGLKFFDSYADITCPNILTPYPGTELYNELKAKGKIYVDDLSLYDQSHVIVPAGDMSYAKTRLTYELGLFWHYNLNPKFYFKLFSPNKFLRRNQYYFIKLVWAHALEGMLNPTKYKKELYAKKEFDKVMNA
ncbi:MAG: radical SAM protein [Candidatus Wallbacteria bacterium]